MNHRRALLLGLVLPLGGTVVLLDALRLIGLPAVRRPAGFDWVIAAASGPLLVAGLALAGLATPPRRSVLAVWQLVWALWVVVEIVAFGFWLATGSSLDGSLVAYFLRDVRGVWPVVWSEVGPNHLAGLAAVVLVAVGLPSLVGRGHASPPRPAGRPVLLVPAAALVALAWLVPRAARDREVASDLGVALLASALRGALLTSPALCVEGPAAHLRVAPDASTPTPLPNVVMVLLESTGWQATSLGGLSTTPELAALAPHALLATRAYAVVPHTSKALIATLCGVPPFPGLAMPEAKPGGLPARCLPRLLGDLGYASVFFQPATVHFEDRAGLVRNMGFDLFEPGEVLPRTVPPPGDPDGREIPAERANYFGYEDAIMLAPSARWIEAHRDTPFLAVYMTGAAHHDYRPLYRYGRRHFDAAHSRHDRYLNSVSYLDGFLHELIGVYERAGVADRTLFFVGGDHGEGFGEHGRYEHDNVLYDEVLHVPMLFWDPKGELVQPGRVDVPVNQLDVLPTILDLLGLEVTEGRLAGTSILDAPADRMLFAHTWYSDRGQAAIRGHFKYIDHYGQRPDELFDLSTDPHEQHGTRGVRPAWRSAVRAFWKKVRATYATEAGR